jgi:hypothetical protein
MKTNLRILLISLVCLVLGVAIGFFSAGRITKKRIHQKVEMQKPPKFKLRLEEKLDLTKEQQETFNSVFMEHMQRMRSMDKEMFDNRSKEFNNLFNALKNDLDSDQIQVIERFEERFKNRKHRPKGGHPPRMRE